VPPHVSGVPPGTCELAAESCEARARSMDTGRHRMNSHVSPVVHKLNRNWTLSSLSTDKMRSPIVPLLSLVHTRGFWTTRLLDYVIRS
jgi:hypothetical protein